MRQARLVLRWGSGYEVKWRSMNQASPIYIRYSTQNGRYVYDALSGQIVRVGGVAYELLDDYFTLSSEEFFSACAKRGLSDEIICTIVETYRQIQTEGFLEVPKLSSRGMYPHKIFCEGKIYDCEEFFRENARLLVLEITQQCNLRCAYCCYGDDYSVFRNHSRKTMDVDIAKKAISEYLNRDNSERHAISFYGGEPLLEFKLLSEIVDFSKQYAKHLGKHNPLFHVTTNGTLLSDDIIHFFVENDVAVLVSVDGPKDLHDRYRKYNKMQGDKNKGTFDDVIKGMRRFVELYPNYIKRGISMVLAPPLNVSRTNAFLKEFVPTFSTSRVTSVRKPDSCYSCEKTPMSVNLEPEKNHIGDLMHNPCSYFDKEDEVQSSKYAAWSREDIQQFVHGLEEFIECVTTHGFETARQEYPLFALIMYNVLIPIHFRAITKSETLRFPVRCLPGCTRLFCDVFGNYYPCERIGTTSDLCLGNVHDGFDYKSVFQVIKHFQIMTKCEDCVADKVCTVCHSSFIKSEDRDKGEKLQLPQSICDSFVASLKENLILYTTVLESSPRAFDGLVDKDLVSLMAKAKFQLIFKQMK